MNIIYMGNPKIAADILENLIIEGKKNNNYTITNVVTNEDKIFGRGKKWKATETKNTALKYDINIIQINKVRNNDEFLDKIKKIKPDLIIVVAYGEILTKEFLEIPKYGVINLHVSLLPKYRGPAPIEWAIINGEEKTGVCTMLMNEKMDEGDIILKEEIDILETDIADDIYIKSSNIGSKLLIKTIEIIKNGKLEEHLHKQTGNMSYAPMIKKEMLNISWQDTTKNIFNKIRGLNSKKSPSANILEQNVKILKAIPIYMDNKTEIDHILNILDEDDINILDKIDIGSEIYNKKSLYIKTKDSFIKILKVKPENRNEVDILSFIAGYGNKK